MADPPFDRDAFSRRLTTRRLGHRLIVRAEVESTNDRAWDALAGGSPEGTVVVADAQTRGRGRAGRLWHHAPGLSLALSVALHPGCDARAIGTLPLVAGLALSEALERLGARVRLKWPNDLLIGDRKVSGILCESRRRAGGGDAVVIGVGVNVAQEAADFPPEISNLATSLALEGVDATREQVAAEFLNSLEPLVLEHAGGGRDRLLARWSGRADFWGHPVTLHTPAGIVTGVARALDLEGALVVTLASGIETTVLAGDLENPGTAGGTR
ncbi:MAG: biotin--[acetyl-CoA-carboxylase] ligase [Candidatus Eisenbacteria bacterium]|nr:biotin--[acetyl-CoA-carboxylase] ligase [Candidatus Eisenbacteria bacterium]